VGILCADHATLSIRKKLVLTSPTRGGRSVGIVRLRTKGHAVFFSWGGVQMDPLGTSATEWPIVPAPGHYDYGVFGGIKIGRGNRSTRRKPAPAPLCPPQIPLDQTGAGTRAAAVGSRRLTA
jgi:hypothetical protein